MAGRFLSPDSVSGSILNPQTLNLYVYVMNNPLKYNDPTGHMAEFPKWGPDGGGCTRLEFNLRNYDPKVYKQDPPKKQDLPQDHERVGENGEPVHVIVTNHSSNLPIIGITLGGSAGTGWGIGLGGSFSVSMALDLKNRDIGGFITYSQLTGLPKPLPGGWFTGMIFGSYAGLSGSVFGASGANDMNSLAGTSKTFQLNSPLAFKKIDDLELGGGNGGPTQISLGGGPTAGAGIYIGDLTTTGVWTGSGVVQGVRSYMDGMTQAIKRQYGIP